MDFFDVIKNRYSCKKYDGRQITREQLDAILEAGRLAPTAKNLQEQHIYVVQSEEGLAKIDAVTPCRYQCKTVLAVAYRKDNVYTYPNNHYSSGAEDATIVATHMMLAAAAVGVDSCWINCFDPDRLAMLLGMPETEELVMLLDLGYADTGAGPLPNHALRKPLGETVTYC